MYKKRGFRVLTSLHMIIPGYLEETMAHHNANTKQNTRTRQ